MAIFIPLLFKIVAPIAALFGLCVFIFLISKELTSFFASCLLPLSNKYSKCPHGIIGGSINLKCSDCAQNERQKLVDAEFLSQQNQLIIKAKEEGERKREAANFHRQIELIRLNNIIAPSIEDLQKLSPKKFEDYVSNLFARYGYQVEQTPQTHDLGRDAIMWKNGRKYLLECKKYSDHVPIGRPALQKFHSAIVTDKAVRGYFVTTSRYADTAIEFAIKNQIELVDADRLGRIINKVTIKENPSQIYTEKCEKCGSLAIFDLKNTSPTKCLNGHTVNPSITISDVLERSSSYNFCPKCYSGLKVVVAVTGNYIRCGRYPECDYTKKNPA